MLALVAVAIGVQVPRLRADDGYDPRGIWTGSVSNLCQGSKCLPDNGGGTFTVNDWNPSTGDFTGTSDDGTVITGHISGSTVTLTGESEGIRLDADMTISADGATWSGGVRYNSSSADNVEMTGDLTMTRIGPAPEPLTDPEILTLVEMLGPAWTEATSVKPWCECGDPVNPATGNLSLQQGDMMIPGLGMGLVLERTYNSMGPAAPGRFGAGWTDSYAAHVTSTGPFVTVWLGSGATVPFKASAEGFSAPAWVTASLARSADGGWVLTFTDRTVLSFDVAGRLVALTDRTGEATTIGYDTSGLLATVTDPSGRVASFASDGAGRVTGMTDPAGRTVAYAYDDAGDLVEVTDVAGGVTKYGYDALHRMTAITDPAGRTATTVYDDAGRVVDQVDPSGNHLGFAYAGTFPDLSTTVTDGNGSNDVFTYHGGVMVSATRGAGTSVSAITTYTYDAHLALASVTDPNGHQWTYVADPVGNVTSVTDPLGRTATATYDQFNDPVTFTDATGVVSTVDYDDHALAVKTVRAVGTSAEATILIQRDEPTHPGEVTGVVDPSGASTTYRYDAFGNIVGETDAMGGVSTATYDELGRVTSTVGPLGNLPGADPATDRTSYTYDAYSSITKVVDPQGNTATATYDDVGNLLSSTDASGHTTAFTDDANGRVTATTFADGATQQVTYDPIGNVLTQTDPAGTTTTFTYDPLGRMVTRADAAGNVWTRGYDPAGNLLTLTDPLGRATRYAYDMADQLTGITYDDPATAPVTFTYDAAGRRESMTDATGTSNYRFDEQSRLVEATDGAGLTVAHAYDARGDMTAVTYPSGLKVGHTYDPLGRLTVVADGLGHDNTFTYDADGNLTGAVLGDGTHTTSTHDRNGAELSITNATATGSRWASFAVERDALEQVATATDTLLGAPDAQATATYDSRRHLTGFGAQRYGIDANGWLTGIGARTFTRDRLGRLVDDGTTAYTFDANGQRTEAVGPTGATSYTYDQAGRLIALSMPATSIASTSTTVANSPASSSGGSSTILVIVLAIAAAAVAAAVVVVRRKRARSASGIGVVVLLLATALPMLAHTATIARADDTHATATYSYNGDGLRVAAVNPEAAAAAYTWDQVDSWPILISDGANQFVRGPGGMPLEQIDSTGAPTWLHADVQGNVRAVTDTKGAVTATYTYDAFGQIVAHTGTETTPIGWQGQYADAGTGLHYLLARYYDPATAQFLTLDPAADITGQPYDYAANNPLNYSDASGLEPTPWYSTVNPAFVPFTEPFTALAGHGEIRDTMFTVPNGTWIHFHAPPGAVITDGLGVQIESGLPTKYNEVYGPGDLVNDHVLWPPDGLIVLPMSRTVKVKSALSGLVKPNQGHIHWAACRPTDKLTPEGEALRAAIRARPYQGFLWHTSGPRNPRDEYQADSRYYQINGPHQ